MNRKKNTKDPSTFESTIERTFSPNYNPEHFLQWAVRNRLTLGFSNTVEPFQDVPQALSILKICDTISTPLFIQSKGINFFDVWDHLRPFHDNSTLFISFPTEDNRAIKRFEPGTPKAAERIKVIETAARAGFHVILALSPYHPDWNPDPGGMIARAKEWGVGSVFYDELSLNRRQRSVATDKVMVDLAMKSDSQQWTEKGQEHFETIWNQCQELDLPFYASGFLGLVHGMPNTLATLNPQGVFQRGLQWPYHDGTLFFNLHEEFDPDNDLDPAERDWDDSILVEWADVLSLMEIATQVDQPFAWGPMSELISVLDLPPAWQSILKPSATISEYYRAFWNSPSKHQFAWRHPWVRIAMQPSGIPWTDDSGNLIMLFDPDWVESGKKRVVEDLSVFRRFVEG